MAWLLAAAAALSALGPAEERPRHTAHLQTAPAPPYFIGWRVLLDAPDFLEWKPRQSARPLPDPLGGRVYVPTNNGAIFCVEDGKIVWRFKGDGAFEGQPRVGPGALYAGSTGGKLYAVNAATGKELWAYDTKEDLGTQPVVASGRVIVASLSDAVIAAEASSGAFAWQYRRESSGLFTIRGASSPAAVGDVVYAGFSDGHVVALSIADGSVRWDAALPAGSDYQDVDGGPLVAGDRLYVAGYSAGAVALDARTGKTVWRVALPGAMHVALDGPRVIIGATGQVVALRRADGAQLWTFKLDGPATNPVVTHRGMLAFASMDGPIYFVDSTTGRPRGAFQPGTGFSASPAARGGALYAFSNGGSLFALGLAP